MMKLLIVTHWLVRNILGIKENEIIYTSGASESNNTAIKGICFKYQNRGKKIITTELEHSSIIAPLSYLDSLGFDIEFVKLDKNGQVDLDDLERLIDDETILVTIASVNSEVGIRQPMEEISKIVNTEYKKGMEVNLVGDVLQAKGNDSYASIDTLTSSAVTTVPDVKSFVKTYL